MLRNRISWVSITQADTVEIDGITHIIPKKWGNKNDVWEMVRGDTCGHGTTKTHPICKKRKSHPNEY